MRKENNDALEVLNDVAHESGHSDLDELIQKAVSLMPPDEKASFEKLQKEVLARGKDFELAFQVIGGVAAIGALARLASRFP